MRYVALLLLALVSVNASATKKAWLCKSVDGVGMSYKSGVWQKHASLESIMFEVKEKSTGVLAFPEWLMMSDSACSRNESVPWISCWSGLSMFVMNPKTGDAMMASTGMWVAREKFDPPVPLAADVLVLRCQ